MKNVIWSDKDKCVINKITRTFYKKLSGMFLIYPGFGKLLIKCEQLLISFIAEICMNCDNIERKN